MELMVKQGYKQTEVGLIPWDWEVESFGDVADKRIKNSITGGPFGSNLKTTDYTPDGIQIIQLQNIGDGKFIDESVVYTSIAKAEELKSCNIYAGEIILSKMGDPVARACLMPSKASRYLMASDGIRLVVDEKRYDKKFVFNYINSKYFRNRAIDISTGSTRQRIGLLDLKGLKFIKPPLSEQKKIATALSDLDELISNLDKLIAKKKAIKQGAMQQLLTPPHKGGKRLEGFSGEWEEKKLGEVTNIKTGSRNNQDKVSDGHYPFFVRSQNIERINSYSYDCEAILVPGEGGIGSIFHYINGKFEVHQRVYKISDFADGIIGKYIFLQMKHSFGKHAMTNTVKATVDSLRLPTFEEFIVPIPPTLEEQKAIAEILSDMDLEIEQLESKKVKYQSIKQGMMQELLTGKTRLI